jgi:hypothetical protein
VIVCVVDNSGTDVVEFEGAGVEQIAVSVSINVDVSVLVTVCRILAKSYFQVGVTYSACRHNKSRGDANAAAGTGVMLERIN